MRHLIEPMLATLARAWFDIPDGNHITVRPHDWSIAGDRPPAYPGDFWSPSLHAFNPFPSEEIERKAIANGGAAVAAVTRLILERGRSGLSGTISAQLAAGTNAYPSADDLARVLVGCMIGGVPTVALNALRLLIAALADGCLAEQQARWLAQAAATRTFGTARDSLGPAAARVLAQASVPELLWRVVAADDVQLGGMRLTPGRPIILSLESASRDRLRQGKIDSYIPFGMAPPGQAPAAHGCPGRAMANGTILGLLVGLIEAASVKPGPGSDAIVLGRL